LQIESRVDSALFISHENGLFKRGLYMIHSAKGRLFVLFAALMSLTSCGGGGGGSSPADTQPQALDIVITFPPAGTNLGDSKTVSVSGRLVDTGDGVVDASDVKYIDINGQLAVLDENDPGHWTLASLDISNMPTIELMAKVESSSGNVSSVAQTNLNQAVLATPSYAVLDVSNNRLLVVDSDQDAIIAIDPGVGVRKVFSGSHNGSGPLLKHPSRIVVDSVNNRLLVVDIDLLAVVAIDLTTGNRSILSDINHGSGAGFASPRGITIDTLLNRALVTDVDLDAVIAVSLANATLGNRSVLADDSHGSGTDFTTPTSIRVIDNSTAVVLDSSLRAIIELDLANGNRAIVSDNSGSHGIGPQFQSLGAADIAVSGNTIMVSDLVLRGLIAVNRSTGDRSLFSGSLAGTGPLFDYPQGIVLDTVNFSSRLLVIDEDLKAVMAVEVINGNRQLLAQSQVGNGNKFSLLGGLVLDQENQRILAADTGNEALVAVDLDTHNRTVVSDIATGSGPMFDNPGALALDADNARVFVVDQLLKSVFAVDLTTGNRTVLSDDVTGSGPGLDTPVNIIADLANNRVIVVDSGLDAAIAINVITGNRTVISDSMHGTGISLSLPVGIVMDTIYNRLLVTDASLDAVVAIDPTSGDRTILSNEALAAGSGPAFSTPVGMVIDSTNQRALVVDYDLQSLFAVDLASGDRIVISDNANDSSVKMPEQVFVVYQADLRQALVSDASNAIIAVNLDPGTNGERVIFSQ
jgi:sugar lactone lactonase YvrE